MKPPKVHRPTRHSTVRRAPPPRIAAPAKAPSGRPAAPAIPGQPAGTRPRRRLSPAKVRATSPASEVAPPPFAEDILRELRAIRTAVAPGAHRPSGEDGELGAAVDSLRRLLSELLERNHESVLRELVPIRLAVADPQRWDPAATLRQIDRLMDRLGAIQFSAQKLDFVDPAIHEIKGERHVAGVPDGVVAESLRPGFRSASGVVLTKAWVAVNRRPADESSRY